jgi:mono/diheme cytochrome c family protein
MPDFRLASWEAAAIAAYFGEHRPEWPRSSTEKDNEAGVAGEKPVEFGALFPSLKSGSPAEGRKLFVMFECAKCHGDPETGSPPPEGAAKDWGPDLKEMARKLTRAGVASALFYPQKIHPGTKMPAFFYDHGEAQDKNAAAQLSDLTAYIESLKGSAPSATGSFRELRAKFRNATPLWGERLVWQFNCAGCHAGTGYAPRKSKQTAVALGYRNAPAPYSREMLVSWLMSPQTIPMHERMHAMGRMPNFGFTTREAVQIADWLFSFDGPGGRGGGGMMMMERMRKRRR